MTSESFVDDRFLAADLLTSTKIHALFEHRRVRLLARELDAESFAVWEKEATVIQQAIYVLDTYYETSPNLLQACEAPMWQGVINAITASRGSADAIVWSAFAALQRYATVERRIHAFDSIDVQEFGRVVDLKCADVRIARALIWDHAGQYPDRAEMAFWNLYDQCWELIEDVLDLDEDGGDWNFNFWLYLLMSGQAPDGGVVEVAALLERKLSELEELSMTARPHLRRLCHEELSRTKVVGARTLRICDRITGQVIASGKVTSFQRQLENPNIKVAS